MIEHKEYTQVLYTFQDEGQRTRGYRTPFWPTHYTRTVRIEVPLPGLGGVLEDVHRRWWETRSMFERRINRVTKRMQTYAETISG